MSQQDHHEQESDEFDVMIKEKTKELEHLGAMRTKVLERANEELNLQVSQYAEMLQSKDQEIQILQQHFMQHGHTREEYEHQNSKLKEAITQKDIEISELKTTVNTYYNDLIALRDETHSLRDKLHKISLKTGISDDLFENNDININSQIKNLEATVQKLKHEKQVDKEKYENQLHQKDLALANFNKERNQLSTHYLEDKENEIVQIRSEYTNLLNQKNTKIKENQREIGHLRQINGDLQHEIQKLKNDERLEENGIRANVQSLSSLVNVKDSIIEKLENDILLYKQEAQEVINSRDKIYRDNLQLKEAMNNDQIHSKMETQNILKEKDFEIKTIRSEYENMIRHLEYDLKLKEHHNDNQQYDDSYTPNQTNEKIKQIYDECDQQTADLQARLDDALAKLKTTKKDLQEFIDENDDLTRLVAKKDKKIHELNDEIDDLNERIRSLKSTQASKPVFKQYESQIQAFEKPQSEPMLQRMNTNHKELEQKLKFSEQENEKLREQAFKADREVDRLKENIILREREIHNIKKSIANDRMRESNGRSRSKPSELGFTFESNPNLINEFAKMSGSSGFKYNQKGPYDESIEKLRKEFSLQQRELGIETVSEASLDRKDESLSSPHINKNIYALMMGQSNNQPTGDLKVDYETLLKENQDLKIVVKTMREEMENIANKMNQNNSNNYLSPEDAKKKLDFDYLNSNNLKQLDLKQENDNLKEQISRMKLELISRGDKPDEASALLIQKDNTIKELKRKLDEK